MSMSNVQPVGHKLLVRPERIEDTDPALARAKAAGLMLAHVETEREQMAQVKATVVAVGGNAFQEFVQGVGFVRWDGRLPQPGDKIMMAKYAGLVTKEGDEEYRLINDEDVVAIAE